MQPAHAHALLFLAPGVGFSIVTSYLFACGERMSARRPRVLTSFAGIVLALIATILAFEGFRILYAASSLPRGTPVESVATILWVFVWFAVIIALTNDAESLWKEYMGEN